MAVCLSEFLNSSNSVAGLTTGLAWTEPIGVNLGPYSNHYVTINETLKAGSTFLKIGVQELTFFLWNNTYAHSATNFGAEIQVKIAREGMPETDWIYFSSFDTSRVGGFGEDRYHVGSYAPVGGITTDKAANFQFRIRYFNSWGGGVLYLGQQSVMIIAQLTV